MKRTYQELKTEINEIQGSILSEDLITNLAADEIYKYCMQCVITLEEIAMTSKSLSEKSERKKAFIESFLGAVNPEYIILQSSINQ